MKKGHSVRFYKIRNFFVPRGFMKWIPKGCEVPNEKKKSIGPTFVKGLNLVAWTHACAWILKEVWRTESYDQVLGRKRPTLKLNQCSASFQRPSTVKRGFLITKHMAHWKNNIKDKTFLSLFLSSLSCLNIFFKMLNLSALNSFCSWLKLKISLTVAEKQPIVSSKQPIVLSLTTLWRNQFNFYFEFLSVANQFKERIIGQ